MPNIPGGQQVWLPNMPPGQAAGGVSTVYVNGVAILYSPWDFSFVFLRGVPSESSTEGPPDEHNFETKSRTANSVIMSPQHAKALLNALAHNIEAYEREHGEIPSVDAETPPAQTPEEDQPKEDVDA
jgi:hypothetical protein